MDTPLNQTRMSSRQATKNDYLEAMIRYLHNPSLTLQVKVEEKIGEYAKLSSTTMETTERRILSKFLQAANANDTELWAGIGHDAENLFNEKPELRELFLEGAKKRCIPTEVWIS